VGTDVTELVHTGEASKDRIFADVNMTAQLHAIGKNRVVSHLTVVSHVHVRHHPVGIADACYAGILDGSAIERAKLADGIVITDFESCCFATIFLVLGYLAQRDILEDAVAGADAGVPGNHRVRPDPAPRTNHDVRSDDAVGSDLHIRRELRARINNGGGMDVHVCKSRAKERRFSGRVSRSR
jgi:hypothetical protein